MKRILFFVPKFPNLTETFIEREISKLIERGNVGLTVFSLEKGDGVVGRDVEAKTVYRRLEIYDAFGIALFFLTRVPVAVGALQLVLGDDRVSFLRRLWLYIKGIGYAMLFDKYSPSHIHAHFLSDPSTIVMVAAKILQVPFSVSAHARDVFVTGSLVEMKAKEARFITVCNRRAWVAVQSLAGRASSKVLLNYHGIDRGDGYYGERSTKNTRPFVFVGSRLVEKKGIEYAIEAAKLLKDGKIDIDLHIVGPGPFYERLTKYVKRLGLEDRVFIHGGGKGLPHEQVKEFFRKADVFVHPSIETEKGDVDGIPTFVAEAAMAKLPIITTDAGSITDLIDASCGILVSQKNSKEIASAIEKVLSDGALAQRLGESAYQKACKMFDLDVNIARLESLFTETDSRP
ncbi:glycosyltransferase family 4 protein [candidate division WWE3 bacterium]|nr:glycosyltransferase family 4 protein [candidate division WWE3 bacterium]